MYFLLHFIQLCIVDSVNNYASILVLLCCLSGKSCMLVYQYVEFVFVKYISHGVL